MSIPAGYVRARRSKRCPVPGERFGRLVVTERVANAASGNAQVSCRCDCGREKIVRVSHLTSGAVVSCGCVRAETSLKNVPPPTHGHCAGAKPSDTYASWAAMIDRCRRPSHSAYANYGGRGIRVCARWEAFENFLADMGERPPAGTIERRDTNGNYEPSNCRWATRKEQGRNRRTNRLLTVGGATKCIAAWSEETGINRTTIRQRLVRGWSAEQALGKGAS